MMIRSALVGAIALMALWSTASAQQPNPPYPYKTAGAEFRQQHDRERF
jgi:hypothetical protein